jgi:hypothetical protein
MAARSQKNAGKLWHPRVKVMMKCQFKSFALLRKNLRRKPEKKITINTLDVSAEEMDFQKKLK